MNCALLSVNKRDTREPQEFCYTVKQMGGVGSQTSWYGIAGGISSQLPAIILLFTVKIVCVGPWLLLSLTIRSGSQFSFWPTLRGVSLFLHSAKNETTRLTCEGTLIKLRQAGQSQPDAASSRAVPARCGVCAKVSMRDTPNESSPYQDQKFPAFASL